jgi:hypothetical protein
MEIGRDVEIGQDEVAARQTLIVLVRYAPDDGGHREVWLIGSVGLEKGGSDADREGQVRHRRRRRCYRGVGANKSKGHPEAFFPLAPS